MTAPSDRQLERHIRTSAADSANVVLTAHAQKRMKQRRITPPMLRETLLHGALARPPEPDIRYPGVKCEMRRYVAGVNVAAVEYVEYPLPGLTVVIVIDVSEG